jgi:hypothetical protein
MRFDYIDIKKIDVNFIIITLNGYPNTITDIGSYWDGFHEFMVKMSGPMH